MGQHKSKTLNPKSEHYPARPIGLGGYGYSGWVWETTGGRLVLKQGPRAFDVETSLPLSAECQPNISEISTPAHWYPGLWIADLKECER
jgi:hypothetical protein